MLSKSKRVYVESYKPETEKIAWLLLGLNGLLPLWTRPLHEYTEYSRGHWVKNSKLNKCSGNLNTWHTLEWTHRALVVGQFLNFLENICQESRLVLLNNFLSPFSFWSWSQTLTFFETYSKWIALTVKKHSLRSLGPTSNLLTIVNRFYL